MATNFPSSLDSLTNPTSGNTLNSPSHSSQHANSNDAIEAIQAKVGVDNSAVTTSLDYKVRVWNPVGEVTMWATNTAPTGWLICDGSAVSRSTYSGLFAIIGTTYGVGNGTTTFNLPNLKGRVVVGRDSADADWDTLGETRGSKTHTLTVSEIPSHSHTITVDSTTVTINDNTLDMVYDPGSYTSGYISGRDANNDGVIDGTSNTFGMALAKTTEHTHTANAHTHTATAANTGGDGAHNNIQPSIVLNFIIRH